MTQYQDVKAKINYTWATNSSSLDVFHLMLHQQQEGGKQVWAPPVTLLGAGTPLSQHTKGMNWVSCHQLELGYILPLASLQLIRHLLSQQYLRAAINCSSTSVATSLRIMQWSLPSIRVMNFQNESSILVQYSALQYYSFLSWTMSACFWHLVLMCFWKAWITSDYQ